MFQKAYLDGSEIIIIAVYGDEAWIEEDCRRRMVPLNTITFKEDKA